MPDEAVGMWRVSVGADELAVVRLEADPATLRRRIVEREPAGWSGLAGLVEAAPRLSAVIAGLDGVDLTLSTEGRRPEAVAERIRERWPERLSRPGAARR